MRKTAITDSTDDTEKAGTVPVCDTDFTCTVVVIVDVGSGYTVSVSVLCAAVQT